MIRRAGIVLLLGLGGFVLGGILAKLTEGAASVASGDERQASSALRHATQLRAAPAEAGMPGSGR